ncbi:MAG TPA: discoidin domain-containing protein, partial [Paludibacteraceae bacterium]|nr:discoidin domain-containing protein [Paludibacteraceae bacterium]
MTATASAFRGTGYEASKTIDSSNDTYWTMADGITTGNIVIDFGKTLEINNVKIQEYMPLGQRISGFKVELYVNGSWITYGTGQTIGHQRIINGDTKAATQLRLTITGSQAVPLISNIEAYFYSTDPASTGLDYTNADFFQTIAPQSLWKLRFKVETRNTAFPSIAELRFFNHENGNPVEIDRSSIATSASSYAKNYTAQAPCPPANTIDGNSGTFWQPEWSPSEVSMPQYVDYNFGKTIQCTEISYIPRQDSQGNIPATFSILTAATSSENFPTTTLLKASLSSATQLAQNNAIATNNWTVIQNYISAGVGVAIQSSSTSAYAQFGVTGWFQLIGTKGKTEGKMDIYIDGVKKTTIDNYATTTAKDQVLYELNGLNSENHLVKIVPTGTKNSSATGYNVTLQKVNKLKSYVNGIFRMEKDLVNVRKDAGSCTLKVTRTGCSDAASVTWSTSPGSGVHGITYTDQTGTLTFAAGEMEKTFTVTFLNNELVENKNFYVGLTNPTNNHIVGQVESTNVVVIPVIYRSKTSGNWGTPATWEVSTDNITFATATAAPNASATRISILNGHEVTIGANATATGLVINPGGKLTLNNTFTLNTSSLKIESNATNGTGTFVDKNANGGLTVSGTASVQQYLTGVSTKGSGRQWWYVASPVSGALSGVFTPSGANNLGYYNETLSTPAYVQIEDDTTPLEVGRGYLAQLKSNNTYVYSGTLNNGTVSLTPTRTGTKASARGFNLVGNPYPSYLNWKSAEITKTNIRQTIWFRTLSKNSANGTMVFDTYDGTVGTGNGETGVVSQYIPPMQGFWVKVDTDNKAASLIFRNAARLHQDVPANVIKTPSEENDGIQILRLKVNTPATGDETIIVGNSSATDDYDSFDSDKMSNTDPSVPEIFTLASGHELVINHLNRISADKTLALGFRPGTAGTFAIEATQFDNINNRVMLLDRLKNIEQELTAGTSYSFTSDSVATNDRFVIRFVPGSANGLDISQDNKTLNVYCTSDNRIQIIYHGELNEQTSVTVYNPAGQKLSTTKLNRETTQLSETYQPGVYLVQLTDDGKKITKKLIIK